MTRLKLLPNCVVMSIQQTSIRGTPDILMCLNGRFVALELKRSSTAPATELQRYNIQKLDEAGGFAKICYPENFEEIFEQLKEIAC